jgi:hypothetical protein
MGRSVEDARAAKKPRGGLSASELHPETLYAGDTIIYYTMAMVFGDQRGKRVAKALTIKGGADYPLSLDTQELITQTQFVKRLTDRTGKTIGDAVSKWRKLRTLTLVDGDAEGETRSSMLNQALRDAVDASYAATRAGLDIPCARMEAGSPASTPGPASTTQAEVTDENDPSFAVVTAMDAETRPTMRTDEAGHVRSEGSVWSSLGDAVSAGADTATQSPGSSIADIGGVELMVGETGSSDGEGHVACARLADGVEPDSLQLHGEGAQGNQSEDSEEEPNTEDSEEEPNPEEAATVYRLLKDIPTYAERVRIRH